MSELAKPSRIQSPYETCGWLTLKDGYLHKTKLAKGLIPSTKLRWFALKQNPNTYESRLEYYEGRTCKGWISLRDATVVPTRKMGAFTVTTYHKHGASTVARTMKLQAEAHDPRGGAGWVVALKNASKLYREHGSSRSQSHASIHAQQRSADQGKQKKEEEEEEEEERAAKLTPELLSRLEHDEGSVAQRANRTGGEELDGEAIDRARWNALQRRFQGADQQAEAVELEEDEDVRLLREMEEEEERRQEEERLAFLAEREARLKRQESVKGLQDTELDDDGVMSEGDAWDPEEEMRLLREAEEEEERRQEEERRLWLEEQRQKKEQEQAKVS